jgi:hypothetical protein
MQQTHGNRAVQRMLHKTNHSHSAPANGNLNRDVQRFLQRSGSSARQGPGGMMPVQRCGACGAKEEQQAVQTTQVQRFETNEHKLMGDEGSGGATIKLNDELTVTFGDITALAGDFFGSVGQIRSLAKVQGDGKNRPRTSDEIKYALYVKVRRTHKDSDFGEEVVNAVTRRYYTLAGTNRTHFTNPEGLDSPTHEELATRRDHSVVGANIRTAYGLPSDIHIKSKGQTVTNAGSYRNNHIMAIEEAARAGKEGQPLDAAMLSEAFASHFLTDAYAAGHIRTPRSAISDWWNPRVPMFWHNLKLWMAENIAKHINDGWSLASMPTVQQLWEMSRDTLNAVVSSKGIPDLTFGDAISGAVHDRDNEEGVMAQVGDDVVKLVGDGQVLDEKDRALVAGVDAHKKAAAGVKASLEDVRQAFEKGKAGEDAAAIVASLRTPDGLFKAEQLWPRALPDSDARQTTKTLNWKVEDPEQLFADPNMRKAIAHFAHEKADTLGAEITLDPPFKIQKELAMKESVLDKLKADEASVIATFRQIINYSPGAVSGELGGVGGHDEDDNALEYYYEAKKKKALASLTEAQRARLINDVISGATLGDEDTMVADLLTTNDAHVVFALKDVRWRVLWEDISGDDWIRIMRRAGPIYWKAQDYSAKESEVRFLARDGTPATAQEMIIIILRTCSPAEVRKIDKVVGGFWGLSFDLDGKWQDEFDLLRK